MDNGINAHPPIDFPISPAEPDTIEDTDGHVYRRGQARRGPAGADGERTTASILTDEDGEDTEGHRYARGYMYEDTEDTEGHAFRR